MLQFKTSGVVSNGRVNNLGVFMEVKSKKKFISFTPIIMTYSMSEVHSIPTVQQSIIHLFNINTTMI